MNLDVNTKEDITFVTRIGEKNPSIQRPLMFGCCSELMKSDILKKAKLLANTDFNHISVVPDLTKKQRQTEAEKKKLMDQRNAEMSPESVFLDEGQGASGGVSYFANFLINLDQ